MKIKYEKPYARNLGDLLPSAKGICFNGSWANTQTGSNCIPGGVARGSICAQGDAPNTGGCQPGIHPTQFGCLDGTLAAAPGCNAGTNPI